MSKKKQGRWYPPYLFCSILYEADSALEEVTAAPDNHQSGDPADEELLDLLDTAYEAVRALTSKFTLDKDNMDCIKVRVEA